MYRSNSTNKPHLLSQDHLWLKPSGASMNFNAARWNLETGRLVIASSVIFFVIAGYGVLFSAFLPLTGISILDWLAKDTHYKYFAILLIPTTSYFVIANWVGWQYYRNS